VEEAISLGCADAAAIRHLNRTSGDWHRGHLLLHRQLLDSAIEQ